MVIAALYTMKRTRAYFEPDTLGAVKSAIDCKTTWMMRFQDDTVSQFNKDSKKKKNRERKQNSQMIQNDTEQLDFPPMHVK